MLAVILKILQIIGIVLLCILGLVLVLAVLAVCLPIRYRISASKQEDTELNAHFKLTYFFRILRIMADYDKKLKVRAKILWFTVFSMDMFGEDEDSGADVNGDEELDDILTQMDAEYENEFADKPDSEGSVHADAESGAGPETETTDSEDNDQGLDLGDTGIPDQEDIPDEPESETFENETENPDETERDDFFSKIKLKFSSLCDKIESARSEYRYYRNVINSNEAHYALRKVKKQTKKILLAVLPRRIHVDVIFGFSSPDITGKVYGLYCLIKKRFDKSSRVIPDFDREVFEGIVEAKGHFSLVTFIGAGLSIFIDKNVRKIYRSFKKHNSKGGERDAKDKGHDSEDDKEKLSA